MNEEGSKQSFIDKVSSLVNKDQHPPKPVDPSTLKNARTQSMVISTREQAEQELQQMQALQQQQAHEQAIEAGVVTAKKTGVYVIIATICIILIVLVAILIFTLIPYLRKPHNSVIDPQSKIGDTTSIGFYNCQTSECTELTELSDGRVLVSDGSYVILNNETEEEFTTAISGFYDSAVAFTWGEKEYVHVKQSTGVGAIFSITDNKYITSNSYESVFTNIEDDVYAGQKWIEPKYIIAKRSGDFRMVNMESGKDVVQGAGGVFATTNNYFIAYDQDGKKRVFNDSNIQLALVEDGLVFTRGNYVIVVNNGGGYDVYGHDGKVDDYDFKAEIGRIRHDQIIENLKNDSNYSLVPELSQAQN